MFHERHILFLLLSDECCNFFFISFFLFFLLLDTRKSQRIRKYHSKMLKFYILNLVALHTYFFKAINKMLLFYLLSCLAKASLAGYCLEKNKTNKNLNEDDDCLLLRLLLLWDMLRKFFHPSVF